MDYLLIFFIFLPQIAIFGLSLPTDNQVFFLLPFTYLFFLKPPAIRPKIPKFIFIPFILMILGFLIGNLISTNYFNITKFNLISLISYAIIPFIFSSGIYASQNPFKVSRSIKLILLILLIVIIIQSFFPSAFDLFISRNVDTPKSLIRGNRSLFGEPSFIPSFMIIYGFLLIFVRFLIKKGKSEVTNLPIFLGVCFILSLLSFSGQILIAFGIVLFSLFGSLFFVFLKSFLKYLIYLRIKISKKIIFNSFALITFFPITLFLFFNFINKNLRIAYFIRAIFENQSLLLSDDSLIVRLHAIYMPFMTPIIDPFNIIPNKSAYISFANANNQSLDLFSNLYYSYSDWFINLTSNTLILLPQKTYSILGTLSYDFSLLGLIFNIYFLYKILSSINLIVDFHYSEKNSEFNKLFFMIFFILYSFINLSLLSPPYWFVAGFLYGSAKKIKTLGF